MARAVQCRALTVRRGAIGIRSARPRHRDVLHTWAEPVDMVSSKERHVSAARASWWQAGSTWPEECCMQCPHREADMTDAVP